MASNGSASAPSLHEDDDYDPGADAEASDHLLAGHSKADRGLILVLLLKCAKDMFKRDWFSESDVYIETWVKAEQGETERVYTSVRRDTKDPVWDEYIEIELEVHMLEDENAVIQLQAWDYDCAGPDTRLGSAQINLHRWAPGSEPQELRLDPAAGWLTCVSPWRCIDQKMGTLVVERPLPFTRACRKTVFLVRHAESVWNAAMETKSVTQLLGFDHQLTMAGVLQARQSYKAAPHYTAAAAATDRGRQWCNAELLCSPLARAVQTALLVCEGHPRAAPDAGGIKLCSVLREVKGTGGLDCVGSAQGDAIGSNARAGLQNLFNDSSEHELAQITSHVEVTS